MKDVNVPKIVDKLRNNFQYLPTKGRYLYGKIEIYAKISNLKQIYQYSFNMTKLPIYIMVHYVDYMMDCSYGVYEYHRCKVNFAKKVTSDV